MHFFLFISSHLTDFLIRDHHGGGALTHSVSLDSAFVCFLAFVFFFFFIFLWISCTVYRTCKYKKNTNLTLKLCLTIPFTPLKIILLRCFQFLIFNNKRYPNGLLVSVWHWLKKSIFFTIQIIFATFINPIALFDTVYGLYCTIPTTFQLYL